MNRSRKINYIPLIFTIIAILILLVSFILVNLFKITKQNIQNTAINSQLIYINDVTNNIVKQITQDNPKNLHLSLKQNLQLRENIEQRLELFLTKRYKYVYIVDKETPASYPYRFLLDAEKNKLFKSEFEEQFIPDNIKYWDDVYKIKKPIFFKHKDETKLWITYLKPIILDGKVDAIIAIDFSFEENETIFQILDKLDVSLKYMLIFAVVIFFVIIILSYIDNYREKIKTELVEQLQEANRILGIKKAELEEKSILISQFNTTLTEKINQQIEKNEIQTKQLIKQSRLVQMGEMLKMIAHQWRQPLNAISLTSSNLEFKITMNDVDNQYFKNEIQLIEKYAMHLSKTIDDFRYFSRDNKIKNYTTLKALINNALDMLRHSFKSNDIEIIEDYECDFEIETYSSEFTQVILNILKNAEDVLVERKITNPKIIIKIFYDKTYNSHSISIEDNAGGINKKISEHIFDPYFSTKLDKDGTGLGLYMSKIIIEDHLGGKLTVTNGKHGAAFIISFV